MPAATDWTGCAQANPTTRWPFRSTNWPPSPTPKAITPDSPPTFATNRSPSPPLHDQLYPTLRVALYDQRRLYSAPITVFGPLLAVVYLGRNYLVFRDTERVQAISRHFDTLVREADVSARAFPDHLDILSAAIT